jgi:V/A-type H+-transporting ATPase subunit C
MGSVKRFAAVNTKVQALEAKLLSNEDFQQLLAKKSVAEVVRFLKENTAYHSVLKDVDFEHIHPKGLEILLKKHTAGQMRKLIHYFTGKYRKFFRRLLLRYEIEDLKVYLRAIIREKDLSPVGEVAILSEELTGYDREGLLKSKNIRECIESLKGTVYYRLLIPYLNERPGEMLFYMEMVLDKLYFRSLSEQAGRLDSEDRKLVNELLGKNIDLLNLQWIYRGLRFYRLAPEELINYTLQNGYTLNSRKIKELCYSKDQEELVNNMVGSKYGFLFDNKDTLEVFMERRIERYMYFLLLKYRGRKKMSIIESIVYIHLLEFEVRDIFSVVEAGKYGLDPGQSRAFLIRKISGGTRLWQ